MRRSLSVSVQIPAIDLDVVGLAVEGITGLVGPSGIGKTTVVECVAGLRSPTGGRILADGEVWFDADQGISIPPGKRRVGYVPQDLALFPHLSARENIAWGAPGSTTDRREAADDLIGRFGLGSVASRPAARLSGGERRRVALARALASAPVVLLLDEPFSGLDARRRVEAADLVADICASDGLAALLVSHDFDDVARIATRVAILESGRLVQVGTPDTVARAPGSAFAAALVGVNAMRGDAMPGDGEITRVTRADAPPVWSTDQVTGPVMASIHPGDLTLTNSRPDDATNALAGRVLTCIPRGARVRVEIDVGEMLVAEVPSNESTAIHPGDAVWVSWPPTTTRLSAL